MGNTQTGNMGRTITLIENAFEKMKNAILDIVVDLAVYIINRIIEMLECFWKNAREFLLKSRDKIEQCKPGEQNAIKKAMIESTDVWNADLKQRLQNDEEISPKIQKAMGSLIDEFTIEAKNAAAA